MTALTADHVEEVFRDCLHTDDEPIDDLATMTVVEGIVNTTDFQPERLQAHADEIMEMLRELPEEFMQSGGGGMSFLNGCMNRNGEQWTGLQQTVGRLLDMGQGIGKVKCLMPREMWKALPGGVPYYVVLDS